ncbi:hypothetical protein [Alistipes sp.]|uniref:hypothetical protein n=1 Tax=Alistipes sp. TaxID=1872444 RepID=UPI003AF14EAF
MYSMIHLSRRVGYRKKIQAKSNNGLLAAIRYKIGGKHSEFAASMGWTTQHQARLLRIRNFRYTQVVAIDETPSNARRLHGHVIGRKKLDFSFECLNKSGRYWIREQETNTKITGAMRKSDKACKPTRASR